MSLVTLLYHVSCHIISAFMIYVYICIYILIVENMNHTVYHKVKDEKFNKEEIGGIFGNVH